MTLAIAFNNPHSTCYLSTNLSFYLLMIRLLVQLVSETLNNFAFGYINVGVLCFQFACDCIGLIW